MHGVTRETVAGAFVYARGLRPSAAAESGSRPRYFYGRSSSCSAPSRRQDAGQARAHQSGDTAPGSPNDQLLAYRVFGKAGGRSRATPARAPALRAATRRRSTAARGSPTRSPGGGLRLRGSRNGRRSPATLAAGPLRAAAVRGLRGAPRWAAEFESSVTGLIGGVVHSAGSTSDLWVLVRTRKSVASTF